MDTVQIVELLVIAAIIMLQLYSFHSTGQKIRILSNLFPSQNFDSSCLQTSDTENGPVQLIKINSQFCSPTFTDIVSSINRYLIRNQSACDFSIIRSIVERSLESRENVIAAGISLPLYTGLLGTFSGVLIGLVNLAFSGGIVEENIQSFIGGVVVAMTGSFTGLLLTLINNSMRFKNARVACDERKNAFYNFLQAELLPHLGNNLFDALDRLKVNINDFNKKFENNILLFDNKFSGNISSLRSAVQSLSQTIGVVVDNTQTQKEFLAELKRIGYNKMAEANIKVFQLIRQTGPNLIEFIEKQKELTASMEQVTALVQGIEGILDRVRRFEQSINNLGEAIDTRQFLGNEVLKRIDVNLNYLDQQFELLKKHEILSSEKIENFFAAQFQRIEALTDKIRREVETALDVRIENNPLQKLHLLDAIDKHMSEIKAKISTNGDFGNISAELSSARIDLSDIRQKLSYAIRESKNNAQEKSRIEQLSGKVKEQEQQKKTTVLNRFFKLFKWSRGRKA